MTSRIVRVVELCQQGWASRDIAQALDMRHQHVLNILVSKGLRAKPMTPTPVPYKYCPCCGFDLTDI